MRGLDSRLKAKVDEALIELRRLYDAVGEEDRDRLRVWINQVVPLASSPPSALMGRLQVELSYPISEEEKIRVAGVPPLAIKNALAHWDRGEPYTPTTFGELGIG
jgi:hypothetical protein